MSKLKKLNEGHLIEAIDRVFSSQEIIDSILLNHALIDAVPQFSEKAQAVSELLGELYQDIASLDSISDVFEYQSKKSK